MNMKEMVKERNEAIIDFVETGSLEKAKAYCKKYKVAIPKNERIMAAGIYKAAQECTDIPERVKKLAREKCMNLGFRPTIKY